MGHLLSGPVSTALQKQASQVQRLEGRAVNGALVTTMTLVSRSPSCHVIMYTRLHLVLSSSYIFPVHALPDPATSAPSHSCLPSRCGLTDGQFC